MTLPTPTEVQAATQRAVDENISEGQSCCADCGRNAESDIVTVAIRRWYPRACQFILDALRAPQVGDEEAAREWVQREAFHRGYTEKGWQSAFLAGIHHARAQSAAEIAEYREALEKYVKGDDRLGVHIARDALSKFPRPT